MIPVSYTHLDVYKRQVGILGGTFDPIHNAHITIAKEALKQFNLDEILIMPTPYPPVSYTHLVQGRDSLNFIITDAKYFNEVKNKLQHYYVGVSLVYENFFDVKQAFCEASQMRYVY